MSKPVEHLPYEDEKKALEFVLRTIENDKTAEPKAYPERITARGLAMLGDGDLSYLDIGNDKSGPIDLSADEDEKKEDDPAKAVAKPANALAFGKPPKVIEAVQRNQAGKATLAQYIKERMPRSFLMRFVQYFIANPAYMNVYDYEIGDDAADIAESDEEDEELACAKDEIKQLEDGMRRITLMQDSIEMWDEYMTNKIMGKLDCATMEDPNISAAEILYDKARDDMNKALTALTEAFSLAIVDQEDLIESIKRQDESENSDAKFNPDDLASQSEDEKKADADPENLGTKRPHEETKEPAKSKEEIAVEPPKKKAKKDHKENDKKEHKKKHKDDSHKHSKKENKKNKKD